MRDQVSGAQRWVVKIGSALLTADGRGLDRAAMAVWVEQMVALRAAGVELVLVSSGAVAAGRAALRAGAPIFCDSKMVANGVTRARLPANNDVICTLDDPRVPALAARSGNTRSAVAVDLWRERLPGSVVAVGNAPTALFRLLELLDEGVAPPAAIVGMPVGFIGAAESKEALLVHAGAPALVVRGRRGGSAMAAAALNALASEAE